MTDTLLSPSTTATWVGAPDVMLRIAGMPVEHADRLRFPRTIAWADEVIAAAEHRRVEGGRLADELAVLVSDPNRNAERSGLIALRRDIFNGRIPRAAGLAVLPTCPPAIVARIEGWLTARRADHQLVVDGEALLLEESAERRSAFRHLANHPRLRAGLVIASPTVDAHLPGYLAASGALNKRQRRLERTLLEYFYRVACKTSPFSTFTGLALGRVTDSDGGQADGIHVGSVDETWSSHVQANVALVGRIVDAVVDSPSAFPALTLALTPGFSEEDERVRFVRRSVARGDDTATVSFDIATDSLFFLKRRQSLGFLVALLSGGVDLTAAEVVGALQQHTGEDEQTCGDFVRHLLRIGLLWLPELGADIHAVDPLADFAGQLRRLGGVTWADDLALHVDGIVALVGAFAASGETDRRRALVTEVRGALRELFDSLGLPDESLPVTLLFEDTVAAQQVSNIDARTWDEHVVAPLSRVSSLLESLEMALPGRLLLRGFFLTRYGRGGRCDDVLDLLHSFAEDIYDEFGRVSMKAPAFDADGRFTPYQNWLRVPELDAVSRARSELTDGMHALWREHQGVGPVEIPDHLVDEVAGHLAPLASELRPQGYFLQLGGDPSAPEVVVNRPTGGLLFSYSRFTNAFDDELADRVRSHARDLVGTDAVLAEVSGGLNRTNLNVHQPLADFHIVSPAEGSSYPPERQLPIADLYVVHDEVSDRVQLRSRRLGKEVVPLYLGYLMPSALPEVPRNLLLFSPSGMVRLDLWGGVPQAESVDGVRVRPQLRYRNVVLGRRTWSLEAGTLPKRVTGEGDAAWFCRWRAWQHAHGLPDQVFVTLPTGDEADGADDAAGTDHAAGTADGTPAAGDSEDAAPTAGGRRSKPSYLDFTSYFSVGVLDSQLRSPRAVVEMTEMLPTESQQYVRSSEGHHVCELAVELARAPHLDREGTVR